MTFPGSSPLTRGKRTDRKFRSVHSGLIPAHAGKTILNARSVPSGAAHPRSRGENKRSDHTDPGPSGSSPLTRGKRIGHERPLPVWRLIPAHAGKTPWRLREPVPGTAHPRSRGENASPPLVRRGKSGSSPLTRGKQALEALDATERGLIPAHAGKTVRARRPGHHRPAHPRSRGENQTTEQAFVKALGSSPLTRGKLHDPGQEWHGPGLIPAHAGKTHLRACHPGA